jgi:hypothetical protein
MTATQELPGLQEYIALVNRYIDRDMTDGMPVIPPSGEAVNQMCAASGLPPDHELGHYPIREAAVTVKDVAVNALMAGCLPEYMPILIAAHQAMFRRTPRGGDGFGTGHMTQTAATTMPAMILNGPVRHALGIKSGAAAFGPGARANAVLGRALRFSIINLARGIPTAAGRSCVGSTWRLTMVAGEDEERSPWPAFHVQNGFEAGDSTLLMMKVSQPDQFVFEASTPEQLLDSFLDRWTTLSNYSDGLNFHPEEDRPGNAAGRRAGGGGEGEGGTGRRLLLLGEEHRALLADWSPQQIREYLGGEGGAARRGRTAGEIRSVGFTGWATGFKRDDPDSLFVKARGNPNNIYPMSLGGRGWSSILVGASNSAIMKLPPISAPRPIVVSSARRSPVAECLESVQRAIESDTSDGLPIMPPDVKTAEAMVEASGRKAGDVIGSFTRTVAGAPVYGRPFTIGEVAATAQIAGCLPEYMPVIVTALEVLLDPKHDMYRVLSEIDGSAPYFVLNGPVRTKLDVNGWRDTFGPWKRSNASMGRAISLCLRNIGGLRYERGLGTASQYTGTLFAELEEASPWEPLHTDYGFKASDSTLMVLDCNAPVYCSNHQAPPPDQFLKTVADELSTIDNFERRPPHRGYVMTLGEDPRIHIKEAGWTRRQVQEFVAERVGRSAGELRAHGLGEFIPTSLRDNEFVRYLNGPEEVFPIAAGGGGAITFDCRGRLLDIRKLPD